ncbi:hypothetical protein FNV43_RR02701 [Rhamnella rubrinervis]|uniref:Uncharacterized protein n=1 Tax=Rhamnella rubrinervis TaxID=2594499 RepID=A0A8K0HHN3_9ROSA|nr:hypothetical protein FNV43_RR02701 [Rhamnella rubrinervis]
MPINLQARSLSTSNSRDRKEDSAHMDSFPSGLTQIRVQIAVSHPRLSLILLLRPTPSSPVIVRILPLLQSTPSLSSSSSAVRIVEPNQVAEENPEPYVELNTIRSEPSEHGPKSVIQHPTLITTDIPSIFKPEDMSYLKKSSIRAFRTTHDMPIFLHFYLKLREGRYAFYASNKPNSTRINEAIKVGRMILLRQKEVLSARCPSNGNSPAPSVKRACPSRTSAMKPNRERSRRDSSVVAINKILEADILEFKQATIDANALPRKSRKWSANRKLPERENRILDDFTVAMKEMNGEMILKFKAGQTSWPTPEPSEDEVRMERQVKFPPTNPKSTRCQPEALHHVQEGSSLPIHETFIEAMEAARTNTPEPNSNMEEVVSVPQPSREDHP